MLMLTPSIMILGIIRPIIVVILVLALIIIIVIGLAIILAIVIIILLTILSIVLAITLLAIILLPPIMRPMPIMLLLTKIGPTSSPPEVVVPFPGPLPVVTHDSSRVVETTGV